MLQIDLFRYSPFQYRISYSHCDHLPPTRYNIRSHEHVRRNARMKQSAQVAYKQKRTLQSYIKVPNTKIKRTAI